MKNAKTLSTIAIFTTIFIIQFISGNVNWCSKTKCGKCTRVADFHSCLECANSVAVIATTEGDTNVYKCEGTDTGISNCVIKYMDSNTEGFSGCKVCSTGYFLDYGDDTNASGVNEESKKVRKCTEGSILNCAIYADRTGQETFTQTCIACKAGYIMTKDKKCGTLGKAIDKCVMMLYDTTSQKHRCVGCEPGYGTLNSDENTTCSAGRFEGCYLAQQNSKGCLMCNVHAGWFSNSATEESNVMVQSCKYYGDTTEVSGSVIEYFGGLLFFGISYWVLL